MNKAETFDSFNKRRKRPDRVQHLRNCGFVLRSEIRPENGKIRDQVVKYLEDLTNEVGGFRHAVTLHKKDYFGWSYFQVWVKEI